MECLQVDLQWNLISCCLLTFYDDPWFNWDGLIIGVTVYFHVWSLLSATRLSDCAKHLLKFKDKNRMRTSGKKNWTQSTASLPYLQAAGCRGKGGQKPCVRLAIAVQSGWIGCSARMSMQVYRCLGLSISLLPLQSQKRKAGSVYSSHMSLISSLKQLWITGDCQLGLKTSSVLCYTCF